VYYLKEQSNPNPNVHNIYKIKIIFSICGTPKLLLLNIMDVPSLRSVYVLEHVSNYHRASVYNIVDIFHLDGFANWLPNLGSMYDPLEENKYVLQLSF